MRFGSDTWIALVLLVAAVFLFASCGEKKEKEEEAKTVAEEQASPEMVEKVEELEAEILRVKEEEGKAAACQAVEEAEQMIFMATEVAWLHRNPGDDLRPAYQKAVAEGTPMTQVFDPEAGEGTLPKRYAEWDEHEKGMAELTNVMATTVSGEHRAESLEAICELSETNPHGYALVSGTLEELSGEMKCGG